MSEDVNWDEKIEEILKTINIEENDFKKIKGTSQVHEKIIEAIEEEWGKYRQPIFKEKKQLLDFVGRQTPQYGKIELVVEVDTWHKPSDNWRKLLDICAKKKVWIYLAKNPKEANENFEEALREFRKLAKIRGEDKSNNVTIFMKVPGQQEVEKRYLFE
ncbi:MAG: hypothetical protein QXP74_05095 [Nitrososphaerota archaeon]